MTKKDYKLIADVIKNFRANQAVRDMALCLANELAKDNPRFDYNKFFNAAGIEPKITRY